MFSRIHIYYFFNIDILVFFTDNLCNINSYIIMLGYLGQNSLVGLTIGELFHKLVLTLIREHTTHFLGIPLGID